MPGVDGLDDPEAPKTPEERRRDFFAKMTKVKRLDADAFKMMHQTNMPKCMGKLEADIRAELEKKNAS